MRKQNNTTATRSRAWIIPLVLLLFGAILVHTKRSIRDLDTSSVSKTVKTQKEYEQNKGMERYAIDDKKIQKQLRGEYIEEDGDARTTTTPRHDKDNEKEQTTDGQTKGIPPENNNDNNKQTATNDKMKATTIHFECPSGFSFEKREVEMYETVSKELITKNQTDFVATFRTREYDQWGETYNVVKQKSTAFKSKYYPKYLKDGMSLYESAMGIGLNLFMTLEILADHSIQGITVFGNDFVSESVQEAKTITLAEGVIPKGNQQGILCPGNSLDLGHVPSNAFDLVYTGYLTTLFDPLGVSQGKNDDEWDWEEYDQICNAVNRSPEKQTKKQRKTDWMAKYLWENVVVPKQQDWFGKWVGEMTRIAKPGVPVIVEQVSVPYCEWDEDWDGVSKSFWYEAAKNNTYNWNIDPDSIEIMDDTIHERRYHVFMLKNK